MPKINNFGDQDMDDMKNIEENNESQLSQKIDNATISDKKNQVFSVEPKKESHSFVQYILGFFQRKNKAQSSTDIYINEILSCKRWRLIWGIIFSISSISFGATSIFSYISSEDEFNKIYRSISSSLNSSYYPIEIRSNASENLEYVEIFKSINFISDEKIKNAAIDAISKKIDKDNSIKEKYIQGVEKSLTLVSDAQKNRYTSISEYISSKKVSVSIFFMSVILMSIFMIRSYNSRALYLLDQIETNDRFKIAMEYCEKTFVNDKGKTAQDLLKSYFLKTKEYKEPSLYYEYIIDRFFGRNKRTENSESRAQK